MTDKLSREAVLKIAGECGLGYIEDRSEGYCIEWYTASPKALERFAAAMYAAGAEGMRDRIDRAKEPNACGEPGATKDD